ncbi:MAG: lysine--tRNA ligase [Candidatus Thorarchaeota archaeon]|nr:MAG: lysine--tRNA ligase [Candidatus Thorarchaeota archaeon]
MANRKRRDVQMSNIPHEEEYSIHWIRQVVDSVLERDVPNYLISTGKSPSGSIHIGSLRELIIADVIKRQLQQLGKKAKTMFIVDDYDPVRSFPPGISLPLKEWAGMPYSDVPDEFGCHESFGSHWANEFIDTFSEFGLAPEIVWTHELYEKKEMQDAVRICLENTEVIREIMIEFVAHDFDEEQKKQYIDSMKTWFPASVVCPECGHLQAGVKGEIVPNRITRYNRDTEEVTFECQACGHTDTVSRSDLRLKLTWRIDWPAKWYIFKVTCEPAGKDHAVKGGSYDTGLEVSKRVFGWSGPVKVPYEWVQIGGHDMTTSKGVVFRPKTWLSVAPPQLYRFLMLKTDLQRTINVRPERIPDMCDEYERFERLYYRLDDGADTKRELIELLYPLSEPNGARATYIPKLPFKYAVLMSQLQDILGRETVIERCEDAIKKQHSIKRIPKGAQSLMTIRLEQARNWVEQFGSATDRIRVTPEVPIEVRTSLTASDRSFLSGMVRVLSPLSISDDEIQAAVFQTARDSGLSEKQAFVVLYRVLVSQKYGPRLGSFINMLGKDWVVHRIESVL